MTDHQKANNRWNMTKGVLAYVALYSIFLLVLAAVGDTVAVTALSTFSMGVLGLVGTLISVNFITPSGGFKKG